MIMPGPDEENVRSTGGQVDDLTMALIDAAYDKEEECREQICDALFDLGKKKPELVLSSSYSYLKKHAKLTQGHRVVLLQCMERIIKEKLEEIDSSLAADIIQQASLELTMSKEVVPEWQTAASGVLVAIGAKYCDDVMDEMLQKFQPGTLPHFFVVQTIGNLAQANVYRMVPHLTAVLGTMLPMLGMAKHDNMKWVFSSALSKFSEAIIEYCANIDKAPDPTVTKERFSQEVDAAFDVFFNTWLQSKEIKLRLSIVDALGHMTHLMSKDKLAEQLPKILQVFLGLYKRHPEPFHITQGLCNVLDAVCEKENTQMEPQLDSVLSVLFPQIFAPLDYTNPMSVKNHNEVLRCFAILARSFSGKLTGILLQKLENGNEKTKIGILTIFKHLINAATEAMEDKQEVVVSGLKMMINEQNNKIKKIFAQVVIAMAHHGYLELEGGQQMLEFIVRQCSLPDDPPGKRSADPEHVTNKALRMMCDNVLQLLATTVEEMEVVLWPYLLELLVPEKYTESAGVVCKCISHIANKKREEKSEDYEIDYEAQANIPKPPVLIARLVVLAGRPTNGRERGQHVLSTMKGLSPNLNENIVELWDTVIPKLLQYLEDATREESWSQKNWEDLFLKMLSKTLDVVDNEDWIVELGEAFGNHIPMYNSYPEEKCLGVLMRKSTKKDFVNKHLDVIFNSVKHTDQTEREGCAISFGFCAASHLDAVLSKLDNVAKNDLVQKSSGLFRIMKDKSEADIERIKATLMLCYGFVALYSPTSLIVSRMEATILRSITPHFANVKIENISCLFKVESIELKRNLIRTVELIGKTLDPKSLKLDYKFSQRRQFLEDLQDTSVKQNLIRTTKLIGESLHPDHLQMKYNFTNRVDFINHMQSRFSSFKLDPKLSDAELFDLIKTSTDCVYSLPKDGLSVKKAKDDTPDQLLETEVLLTSTVEALHDLLKEIMIKI
ncbi:hypothetical protein KUTeg_019702 [Tegillarca granosa]|uniref:Maestro heat-like repeat-containing protein family member 1 n=1 Tax=Tegillarca granosa TaxID=220873 RepID=A0ABQ9ED81_TEGGR|nr:hypothetical protein KUTeg_019702 [Tegillarca granosa]